MLSLSLMPSSARALAAVAVASACLLAGCGEGPKQAAAPPPKVTVAKPTQRTIVDQDEYVGRFVPVDVVEIRARVSGYLDRIHFIDGQILKQGDLLFTIDKRPFQNTLSPSQTSRVPSNSCANERSASRFTSSGCRLSATPRPRWRPMRRW